MPLNALAVRNQENLGIVFQEILTAIERLRVNRQPVTDAETFRAHISGAISAAERESRKNGYSPEDFRVALFAVVALLDETVQNLRSPVFAGWPRRTMQEELFATYTAGEIFFGNIDRLLQTNDSDFLADVLEVYELCLLLGYAGRYSESGKGELRDYRQSITDKIRRIRGNMGPLSPEGKPLTGEIVRKAGDAWTKRLIWVACFAFVLTVALFVMFNVSLKGTARQLEAVAASR